MTADDGKPLPRLVKIEYTYEDGRVDRAEGRDAEEIDRAITGAFQFQALHGWTYDGPTLKTVQPVGENKE